MHGVEKSQYVSKNLRAVEDFCSRLEVLSYDEDAASHYGEIRADLERKGKPIGVNDLHIAGDARSLGVILVSNNPRNLSVLKGLGCKTGLILSPEEFGRQHLS